MTPSENFPAVSILHFEDRPLPGPGGSCSYLAAPFTHLAVRGAGAGGLPFPLAGPLGYLKSQKNTAEVLLPTFIVKRRNFLVLLRILTTDSPPQGI